MIAWRLSPGQKVTFWDGSIRAAPRGYNIMPVDFAAYCRRFDVFDYLAERQALPSDITELLGLAKDVELEDTIIVDHEHYAE